MAWPHMTAKVDGQPVPAGPDEWGRLRVMVPAGAKTLEVRYTPPWAKGMLFGAAIALATAVGAVAALAARQIREQAGMTRRRFVVLDRDGTIIVERQYLSIPDHVELLPGRALV